MKRLQLRATLLGILAMLSIGGSACQTTPEEPLSKPRYVVVFLKSGPDLESKTPEERQTVMTGHMANIVRLSDEGKLLVAGPFGSPRPDENLRGIFILDTPHLETAREWANTDPGVRTGVFALEFAPFQTDAPLRRSRDLYREETAELDRSGVKTEMGERVRGYVMVLTRDRERMERAIQNADAESKVIFDGELEGSPRGTFFGVLDAASVEEARQLLGDENVGKGDLAAWHSTKALAGIARAAR